MAMVRLCPLVITVLFALVSWPRDVHSFPTLGVFTQCMNTSEECVGQAVGLYPLCTDCAKFVICSGQNGAVQDCPAGTVYDVTIGVCNYPWLAVCGTASPTTPTPTTTTITPETTANNDVPELQVFSQCVGGVQQCEDDSLATGQYPHCSDCAKFVKCNGAMAASAVITCDNGLQYDVNLGVCTFMGEAMCGTDDYRK